MRSSSLLASALLCLHALCAASAAATADVQAAYGAIQGTVTFSEDDTSGSVSGAEVTADPGGRTAATDEEGRYRLDQLPVGTYTLTVSSGRGTLWRSGVDVTAGATTTEDFRYAGQDEHDDDDSAHLYIRCFIDGARPARDGAAWPALGVALLALGASGLSRRRR